MRRRKAVEAAHASLKTADITKKAKAKQLAEKAFKRAETFIKEYREREKEEIRLKNVARQSGDYYVSDQPRLAFVIRIKGINKIPPGPKKTLRLLRLLQINNGVFVRLNKATQQMLKIVEPYVAYGIPNLKTIRELIYKRGHLKINGQRIPITDNNLIEGKLGKFNIICMEDLIHEIFTVGSHFKEASNALWPFKLNNPRGGMHKRKSKHFVEGGDSGDREEKINDLIMSMN